jgi:hypothetical protein
VELYERIRKDNREAGLGIRALAARHHVHRRTVREALASSVPSGRKVPEREAPALGPWVMLIRPGCCLIATCPASSATPPGCRSGGWRRRATPSSRR